MRLAAFLLMGVAAATSAQAQSGSARIGLLPMPDSVPSVMFAPEPIAGALLRPLDVPVTGGPPVTEIQPAPEAAVLPVTATEVTAAEAPPVVDPAPVEPVLDAPAIDAPAADAPPVAAVPSDPVAVEEPPAAEPPPAAPEPTNSTVTVIVENVESAEGMVNVAICDKSLSHAGCPYIREIPAQQGFVEATFNDIAPGTYAVVGYHDVNGNDEFDRLLGMPREPYALSSAAGEKLVPTFADAALPIKAGENAIIIRLKRLGG